MSAKMMKMIFVSIRLSCWFLIAGHCTDHFALLGEISETNKILSELLLKKRIKAAAGEPIDAPSLSNALKICLSIDTFPLEKE